MCPALPLSLPLCKIAFNCTLVLGNYLIIVIIVIFFIDDNHIVMIFVIVIIEIHNYRDN